MFKSMSASVARSPFVLLLTVAFLGLVVLAQLIYFSPRAKAASSTTIVISEVDADTPLAGTDTANEWFELQNVSAGDITLTNWTITDNVSSDPIPTVTLGPGGHVIIAATAAGFASEHPGFTGTVLAIGDGAIGNGLANSGDALILKNELSVVVDGLSWGSNATVLDPSAGIDSATNTNQRNAAGTDTDTAADWTRATETPNGNTNFTSTTTNPTGVGAANPSALLAGNQTLLTVTVTPGSSPVSTGLSVSGNLSSIGGSATQQFFDDGTNGDVVAGNNVFSYSNTVSGATTPGAKTIPFSITDAEARSGSGNISLTIAFHDPAEHLVMGNPSNAVADPSVTTNFLMMKLQYALSYSDSRGAPNWTSWHLDSTWLGSAPRQGDFRADPDLPPGYHRVQGGDFAGSGFDRGHMCPSADRLSTVVDNSATFLMTNMVAQAPEKNEVPWAGFEDYLRTFLPGSEIYIISGGSGTGGTGELGSVNTIAGGFVNVPAVTWKVALILPVGDNDMARVNNSTETIAVIMPNTQRTGSDPWETYLATVDQVEALSGYDFYSNVPTAVQDVIEARLDAENDTPPSTSDQTVTTVKDQAVAVTLSATDFNVNNTFTFSIVGVPVHGSLSGSNGNLTYSPNPHYVGPDFFTFRAYDGALYSNVSTVTIMVNEPSPCSVSNSVFNNGEWIIEALDASILEAPFEVRINGNPPCTTKLLAFANRVRDTSRFPQVFDLYSSGYIRMKAGADPSPPLPFGQSLVLGPAIFGTSASFPAATLFFRPQLQRVDIDTSQLHPDGSGTLLICVTANDSGLLPTSTNTNQIMNQTWGISLHEPTNEQTRIDVAGTFTFTETVTPDATRTTEFQSFRLLQISSMFIDSARHDVDAFRIRNGTGLVTFFYDPGCFNQLCPPTPSALDPSTGILDSLHTDDVGQPNGNTPSYRILMGTTTGPISGPITPRLFITPSQDVNDDNLGLWLHQQPLNVIPQGTSGSMSYTVVATTDPIPGDTVVQLSAANYNVGEGDSSVIVTVNRSGDTSGVSTVDFAASDGTASQLRDYEVANGTLTFAAGETNRTFRVLIVDDVFAEANETVNLTLSNPTGSTLAAQDTATITIIDNDSSGATSPVARQFVANLIGADEVPATTNTVKGNGGVVQLSNDEMNAKVSLLFSGLTGSETGAHIHSGAHGVNGPIIFPLPLGNPLNNFVINPAAQQVAELRAGNQYVNVHSSGFPNGEIRGQLQWNPAEEADFFVRQAYFDFLSRGPDADGFAYWTSAITNCQTDVECLRRKRVDVSNAFFYEQEFQQTAGYVLRLYRGAYGNNQPFPNPNPSAGFPNEEKKLPSYAVFVADRARVIGAANLAQSQADLANLFVMRPEFVARYPASLATADQFVDALLLTLQMDLGVNLNGQRANLISIYNTQGGRGAVLYRLADDNATNPIANQPFIDEEYNRSFVLGQYFGYLRRNPDIPGLIFWLGQVNGAPLRDLPKQHAMVCSFITSGEFQLRFGPVASRNNSECPQ
jgi:DNA/RNA endonuclease G (NUC1)